MSINATLFVQAVVFAILVWFTMKFVWPMILGPLEERQRKIATGLAAADQGRTSDNFKIPGTESQRAIDLFRDHTPAFAGGVVVAVALFEILPEAIELLPDLRHPVGDFTLD